MADPGAPGRHRLRLSIALGSGAPRERRLAGGSCALVTSAAAVVLALAIDAEERPARPAPEPPSAAPSIDEVLPAAPPPPPRQPEGRAGRRRVWEIAAVEGIDFASLPAPAAGFGLRGALDLGADRVEIQALTWLSRRAGVPGSGSVGVDVSLHAAGLRYCRWLVGGALDLAPCAGIEGGVLRASGVGAASVSTGLGRWAAASLGLQGVLRPSPRFGVSLEVDGLALLARDRFTMLGAGTVYRPPPATIRGLLGLVVRFP
jgi:hypothetical protein